MQYTLALLKEYRRCSRYIRVAIAQATSRIVQVLYKHYYLALANPTTQMSSATRVEKEPKVQDQRIARTQPLQMTGYTNHSPEVH